MERMFTPSFVAIAREVGWDAATEEFKAQCLTLAPPPGADLELEAAIAT
jgi:hypothetical protein